MRTRILMQTKCFEGILFISGLKATENYACNVTLKDKKGSTVHYSD